MTPRNKSVRPVVLDPKTSARLGRVRQHGTAPELQVRRMLTALGFRYRVRNRDLPGSPDMANRKRRWAVFVHGCFWHHHEGCSKATTPKRNPEFWKAKFSANEKRDARAVGALKEMEYRVAVVWECELKDPEQVLLRLHELR